MRKLKLNIILSLFILCNIGASAAVGVKVFDISTKQALSDVAITIEGTDFIVFTDSSGTYDFDELAINTKLRLNIPGYQERVIYSPAGEQFKVYLTALDKAYASDALQIINPTTQDYTVAETYDDMTKTTGVYNVKRSGMPGEGNDMYIRGVNSLNTMSNPVFIVDGMVLGKYDFTIPAIGGYAYSTMAGLNPEDIESVEVLKDASELAKYGFRGANGIVVIKTTKAKEGKTAISYRNSLGVLTNPRNLPMLNGEEHAEAMLKQLFSAGYNINHINENYPFLGNSDIDYKEYAFDTDWQDEVFDNGLVNNHYFSYTGGDQVAKMYLSIGYTGKKGTIKPSDYNRLTSKINSQIKITDKLSVDVNMNFNFTTSELVNQSPNIAVNPLLAGLLKSPLTNTQQVGMNGTPLATLADEDALGYTNPAALRETAENSQRRYTMLGNYKFRYQFSPAWGMNALIGIELDQDDEKAYYPNDGIAPLALGEADQTVRHKVNKYLAFQGQLSADYNKSFGANNISVDMGMFMRRDQLVLDVLQGFNTGNDALTYIQNTESRSRIKDGLWEYMMQMGAYATASYDYANKYYLDLSASTNASSRIGTEAKGGIPSPYSPMGVFPSAKLSWEIANEAFLKESRSINSLRPHISYGLVGSDLFGNYLAKDYYVPSQYYNITGLQSGGIVNKEVKWESASILNAGIDMELLSRRIGLSANYYIRDNKDLLVSTKISDFYGMSSLLVNNGEAQTKGIELSLYSTIIDRDFQWKAGVNITQERSEITKLPNDEFITFEGGEKINTVGEQPGAFYGYEMIEVFQTEQAATEANLVDQFGNSFDAGDIHFADLNDDHIIDESDRKVIGNPHPDFYGNFYNHFSYKGFSLDINLQFVYGNEAYNHVRYLTENSTTLGNKTQAFLSAWTGENSTSQFPSIDMLDLVNNDRFSSRWIEDASYLRVKDITLAYTIAGDNIKWLSNATIFVTGHNLITLTDYLGYDPEFSYGFGYQYSGIDYGKMPQSKAVLAGIRIDL